MMKTLGAMGLASDGRAPLAPAAPGGVILTRNEVGIAVALLEQYLSEAASTAVIFRDGVQTASGPCYTKLVEVLECLSYTADLVDVVKEHAEAIPDASLAAEPIPEQLAAPADTEEVFAHEFAEEPAVEAEPESVPA